MNVAKYIVDLFPNQDEQLEKLIEFKEHLNLNTYKNDCGCVYYIIEKEGIEPLYKYLNICVLHLFTNKIVVDRLQEIHKKSTFKPLLWEQYD